LARAPLQQVVGPIAASCAMGRFRPVWHGVSLPESPESLAILDEGAHMREQNSQSVSQEQAPSIGFTQVHVSGLPADCDDETVETKLRQALLDSRRRRAAAAADEATKVVGTCEVAEPEACDAAAEEGKDLSTGTGSMLATADAAAEAGEASDDLADAGEGIFISCAVVRHKDTLACKGYCFLSFKTLPDAEEAVQCLNEGVEVAGMEVKAQLSQPKASKTKQPKAQAEQELHDLRIGRRRYQCVSKRAQYGHLTVSSGRDEGGSATLRRNAHGRISGVAGTRGGKEVQFDDSKCSSRSGFRA